MALHTSYYQMEHRANAGELTRPGALLRSTRGDGSHSAILTTGTVLCRTATNRSVINRRIEFPPPPDRG
jgi:hypothetical protein